MIKNKYDTYGASFDGAQFIYYCYNDKLISIEEIATIQYETFLQAMKKQYHVFYAYNGKNTLPPFSLN